MGNSLPRRNDVDGGYEAVAADVSIKVFFPGKNDQVEEILKITKNDGEKYCLVEEEKRRIFALHKILHPENYVMYIYHTEGGKSSRLPLNDDARLVNYSKHLAQSDRDSYISFELRPN